MDALLEQEVAVKEILFKMKRIHLFILLLIPTLGFSQESLSDLLNKYNTKSVPYISVEELAMPKTKVILLDAREPKEYEVSHLKGAINVGYNEFDLAETTELINDKQQTLVVYCSLGIRSEVIAEKLSKAGYTNIFNLYGGIFEWKNEGFDVYDSSETKTEKIHAFSPEWSKWLINGKKVYE